MRASLIRRVRRLVELEHRAYASSEAPLDTRHTYHRRNTMTHRYDDIERELGISAYCSPHDGFASVVKARYADFVVHEVDLDGNIARLESVETPQPKADSAKDESPANAYTNVDAVDESAAKKVKLSESENVVTSVGDANNENSPKDSDGNKTATEPVDWDSRKQDVSKLVGDGPAEELVLFLQQHEANKEEKSPDEDAAKFYTLPLISDKQVRRSIHFLMKSEAFSGMARADNHEGRIRVWHSRFESDMPKDTFAFGGGGNKGGGRNNNNNNTRKNGPQRPPWPKDRPNFLKFVLYKENIDTTTAAKDVCRMARLDPKRGIGYAGMKDKRGITTQFCTAYRMEKEQLLAVNAMATEHAEGGGNTSTRGRAIIKVGNFTYSSKESRLGTLSGNRFDIVLRNIDVDAGKGKDGGGNRRLLVQKTLENAGNALKTHGFINYFGMQRFGRSNDTHEVGIAVLGGDLEKAIDIIMREKTGESTRITEARRRWAKRFESIDVSKDEAIARDAEMKCAQAVRKDIGRFMVCEQSIVHSLSRKPRDYKRAFGSIAKNMRSMFLHAYQSLLWNKVASHRIETGGSTEVRVGDLVLVGDKSLEAGGSGTSGLKGKSVKHVEEQDVMDSKYLITDVVIPLAGSKIQYPKGSSGELFDELMKIDGVSKESFAQVGKIDRDLALGGDYRKLICKPSDVSWTSLEYKDPVEPLLQTDLMKVNDIGINAKNVCADADAVCDDDTLFGMAIGFSLPPSSYATIALRELTKRPTASEYQGKLELSGKCERNIISESS